MTNNQHGQVPEALRLANVCSNLTKYSMEAHLIAGELRRQHARIAELESELEAVGAGGVQALSAAPVEQEEAAQRLRKTLDIDPGDVNDPLHPRYIAGFKSGHAAGRRRAAPAASPTPPAEQAAPKAAPGELSASAAKDAVMGAAHDFRDAHISGSINLKRSAHAVLEAAVDSALAAPQPAPAELERLRERIARTSGSWVVASTWLRNNYQDYPNIASLCDAMLEAAPQQEARTPAPDCHHRPPCDECAAIAAQRGNK